MQVLNACRSKIAMYVSIDWDVTGCIRHSKRTLLEEWLEIEAVLLKTLHATAKD